MKTLRSLFSIGFICLSLFSAAQDTIPPRKIFIRPGIDLSRMALPFIKDYPLYGFEASIDAEYKFKYFPIAEFGWNKASDDRPDYQYQSEGYYARIGMNYNMLNYKHRLDRNLFFVGGRFAYSWYHHQFDNVIIENEWGTLNTSLPNTELKAFWIEAVLGLKGEIAKNLFLGYTIRVKVMASRNEFSNFTPYIIPGFGEGDKTTTMGMSITMSYALPLKNN